MGFDIRNKRHLRWLVLAVLALGIGLVLTFRDSLNAAALTGFIDGMGALAPVVFILVYVLATVFFAPGSVLTLAGGALFGPVLGTVYNITGATLGAAVAFYVARYLASDWVEQKTGGRLKQLKDGVEQEGWRFVAFVRLVPLFPFNLLNYALGLTRIDFIAFLWATYVFMLPGAIAYTYLGYAGKEAIAGGEGLIQKGLLALALLALVAFIPRIVAHIRQGRMVDVETLRHSLEAEEGTVLDVRTAADFDGEQGHIEGALNLPLEELPSRLDELGDYKGAPLFLVCRTDRRSAKAATILAGNGFTDVHVVRGGMTAWHRQGWPVEEAATA
ncbi:MAG: VTT domain-containing protein [Gammaproteobacteria bacterium]|nr:VTT domain-containing protein [Gammaproteobacteria bacterium]